MEAANLVIGIGIRIRRRLQHVEFRLVVSSLQQIVQSTIFLPLRNSKSNAKVLTLSTPVSFTAGLSYLILFQTR